VAFFLAAFFLHTYPGYILLFNLIFSYLWLVAVAFTASDFTHSNSALLHTVEAFSFIALYVTPYTTSLVKGCIWTLANLMLASHCCSTSSTTGISATGAGLPLLPRGSRCRSVWCDRELNHVGMGLG
jgi:hypothetical protein